MAEEVKLFQTWSSPFSLRIAMALKVKGVPCESVTDDLSNKSDLLLKYNPVYKKIPVLLHKGKPISESSLSLSTLTRRGNRILSYLKTPLRGRWCDSGPDTLMPLMWSVVRNKGEEREAALVEARKNLKTIEGELEGKKFFGGKEIGFMDIVMGWLAYLIDTFEVMFGGLNMVDPGRFPLLSTWMKEFYNVPIIKELWPLRDDLVSLFMAGHAKQASE